MLGVANSTLDFPQNPRFLRSANFLAEPHFVYFTTANGTQSLFNKRINLRVGSATLFKCYSDTLPWATASTFAQVSLYICSYYSRRHYYYGPLCTRQYQYDLMFTVRRDIDWSNVSFQYLSYRHHFMLQPQPSHSESIELRISMPSVSNFDFYSFCQVAINSRNSSQEISIFKSDFILVRFFGICFYSFGLNGFSILVFIFTVGFNFNSNN